MNSYKAELYEFNIFLKKNGVIIVQKIVYYKTTLYRAIKYKLLQ